MRGAGVAVVAASIILMAGSAARAQVPEQYGFFGHIDGRWMWLGGDQVKVTQSSSNGPGGQLLLGYKWSPDWDVALAGDIQGLMTELTKFRNGTLSVDTRYQHVDLELGYSFEWWRFNFGLRGIHYKQGGNYNTPSFSGYDQREMFGIGPKVGVGARFAIADHWAIVGSADAALVFTSFNDTGNGVLINNSAYWGVVPQLGAELGINWRSPETPSFSVTVGGRIAASFNTAITANSSSRGTLLDYGPFVRIAYNFGGPARRPAIAEGVAQAALPIDSLSVLRVEAARAQRLQNGLANPATRRGQISH